jgi:hypothetical protein
MEVSDVVRGSLELVEDVYRRVIEGLCDKLLKLSLISP